MAKSKEITEVPRELRKILSIKLTEEGWDHIKQFCRGAGVPYSLETVRRAFNAAPGKKLDTLTLVIIMKCLNYAPAEIKIILGQYLPMPDPVLDLIGDGGTRELNNAEEKLVSIYRELIKHNPVKSNKLADLLDMLAEGTKINSKKYTEALRR